MSVRTRIASIHLMEKEKKNPVFFEQIGVTTELKVIMNSNKNNDEKNDWNQEGKNDEELYG